MANPSTGWVLKPVPVLKTGQSGLKPWKCQACFEICTSFENMPISFETCAAVESKGRSKGTLKSHKKWESRWLHMLSYLERPLLWTVEAISASSTTSTVCRAVQLAWACNASRAVFCRCCLTLPCPVLDCRCRLQWCCLNSITCDYLQLPPMSWVLVCCRF